MQPVRAVKRDVGEPPCIRKAGLIPSQAKMLVMKAVLLPDLTDDRAVKHNKLDLQDVEDKYTITHLLVVLLKAHVEHMELRLAHRAAVVEAPCLESLESGEPS